MDPKHLFFDERLSGGCAYCGKSPETRDHVPARIFLDQPYPENMGVVDSCLSCNNSASADETYLVCLLECVVVGTTDPQKMERAKVRKILNENDGLRIRLEKCVTSEQNQSRIWMPEWQRVRRLVVKLAQGHAAYELSHSNLGTPDHCSFVPLGSMSPEVRQKFESENLGQLTVWPEIGTRAFIKACRGLPGSGSNSWLTLQPERYRYIVDEDGGVRVRIVLRDYLACEIGWE